MNKNVNPIMVSKAELADKLNIHPRTLSRWLNEVYFDEIKLKGYKKTSHWVFRPVLNYLFPFGINYEVNADII